jgi:hypothetical protein
MNYKIIDDKVLYSNVVAPKVAEFIELAKKKKEYELKADKSITDEEIDNIRDYEALKYYLHSIDVNVGKILRDLKAEQLEPAGKATGQDTDLRNI